MQVLEFECCSCLFSSALIDEVFKDRKVVFFVTSRRFCVSWSNPLVLRENVKLKMVGLVTIYR